MKNLLKKTAGLSFSAIIIAICILLINSVAEADTKTISFSGYEWIVKNDFEGPGPNWWTDEDDDVYVDKNGALHLSVINHDDIWYSSEVYLQDSLGYGTYRFETESRVDKIDLNLVLGLFLYQDDNHEIDIEYSKWGETKGLNGGYSVQPYYIKGNNKQFKFKLKNSSSIHEIKWKSNKIAFKTIQNGMILKKWIYSGTNNFVPGNESVHINFWMMDGLSPSDNSKYEIVINSFEFIQ